eukprot:scaffold1757_cov266-Pinguiococcus_pyrenoidosus.AAC.10
MQAHGHEGRTPYMQQEDQGASSEPAIHPRQDAQRQRDHVMRQHHIEVLHPDGHEHAQQLMQVQAEAHCVDELQIRRGYMLVGPSIDHLHAVGDPRLRLAVFEEADVHPQSTVRPVDAESPEGFAELPDPRQLLFGDNGFLRDAPDDRESRSAAERSDLWQRAATYQVPLIA